MVLEFDDVTALKDEDYNDTAGNGQDNPAIADPEGTEVNQVYLSYQGLDKTDIRYGRQRILLDNERFVGGVGWSERTDLRLAQRYQHQYSESDRFSCPSLQCESHYR
ncbi:MAG: hypothetical protein R3F47_02015 [Gammaproteobacteria bacterium]